MAQGQRLLVSVICHMTLFAYVIDISIVTHFLSPKFSDLPQAIKVARYSFPGPIPPKFEHKLRRHKQSFEKIATTVELDKDENLL